MLVWLKVAAANDINKVFSRVKVRAFGMKVMPGTFYKWTIIKVWTHNADV